ncbi:MAG: flippase-like domain-containing protein [Polyangiaceae bacterium]|nr:flippase-like domain-containing protein [Polyangiaceae bacterium]
MSSPREGEGASEAGGLGGLRRKAAPLLGLLALGFVAVAAVELARRWDDRPVTIDVTIALLALAPALAAALVQGFAWIRLVERMAGHAVPRLPALALYLDSQLARYVPGKVGLPLVRMAGADRLGVPARLVGASVGIELVSWLGVGGTVGAAAMALVLRDARGIGGVVGDGAALAAALLLVLTLALLVVDRARFPRPLASLWDAGRGPLLPRGVPLLHAGYWCLLGLHGVLLVRAAGATHGEAAGFPALVLAPIAGFLALFAPAGAGVREVVLALVLAPSLGSAGALAVALLARGASLASDVGVWALVRVAAGSAARGA